jgi:metallo-beta-lactamase family protein
MNVYEYCVLFIESTYGNRDNPAKDPESDLARIANDTMRNKGVLLIPAFAVGRAHAENLGLCGRDHQVGLCKG